MSEKLISAAALREEMNEYILPLTENNLMGAADVFHRTAHLLEEAPAVDAEPVRHGYWIKVDTSCGIDVLECSECHKSHPQKGDDYCRDCGAKMDGAEREGTETLPYCGGGLE